MSRSHLKATLRRVQQLEAIQPPPAKPHRCIEEQVGFARALYDALVKGYVFLENNRYDTHSHKRWQELQGSDPDLSEFPSENYKDYRPMALLLTVVFITTKKHYPTDEALADLSDREFLEAIYKHFGERIFE